MTTRLHTILKTLKRESNNQLCLAFTVVVVQPKVSTPVRILVLKNHTKFVAITIGSQDFDEYVCSEKRRGLYM